MSNVAQQKRSEDYQRWSGASPVEKDGQVKQADQGVNQAVVDQEVNTIRSLLKTEVKKVRLDISNQPLIAAIRDALTEEERARVEFGDGTHG